MRYLSVCSGIEAATAAWHPLGWPPVAFSEVDAFPSAVLTHHYPSVPNWGDMTRFQEWPDADVDVLVGGTPCQSFSVAGLRKGLDDPRGALMLVYLAIARKYRPRWVVWENVPGVLSADEGRAFGSLLGGLGELGYGASYRVLDAQYFGVAQRRKRVFVVGCLGDWRRAAAVLFERASLSGHPAPRREAGQVAPTVPARRTAGGGLGTDCDGGLIPQVAHPLTARMHKGVNTTCDEGQTMVAHSLRADGFDASEDGTGRGTPLVPMFLHTNKGRPDGRRSAHTEMVSVKDIVETLTTDGHAQSAVAVPVAYGIRTANTSSNGWGVQEECTHTLDCAQGVAVAPLVPVGVDGYNGALTGDVAATLGTRGSSGTGTGPTVLAHAFDARQSDVIQYGDQTGPLDTDGHTIAVAFSVKDYGADAGDIAPTLRAGGHANSHANGGVMPAVALNLRGRDGGSQMEASDVASLRAASGGSSRSYIAHETSYNQGINHASTQETHAGSLLRALREEVGAEAFTQWGLGILDSLLPAEVLRSRLHGCGVRLAAFSRRWLVYHALSRPEAHSEGIVLAMREAEREGCASQEWRPPEQLARELGAYLSELSHPGAQASRFMLDLWQAGEGLGLLRQALSAVQEVGRPAPDQSEPAPSTFAVRRLTVEECEFLQGFPRGYTAIPYRGKPAADGPRYKALGNSMAVPVMAWIGKRIQMVEEL